MPLIAIVTGLEHSGTTNLANLLRSHSQINGGFECGILLGNTPADFPKLDPFYKWMQYDDNSWDWAISAKSMESVVTANNWEEMYEQIISASPLFSGDQNKLVDKTPRYSTILSHLLHKVTAHCFISFKPINDLWLSYKKRNYTLEYFQGQYTKSSEQIILSLKVHPNRITLLNNHDLQHNRSASKKIIFEQLPINCPTGEELDSANKTFNYPNIKQVPENQSEISATNEELEFLNQFSLDHEIIPHIVKI